MTVLDRNKLKAYYEEHEPVPSEELVEEAKALFDKAMFDLSVRSAALENRVAGALHPVFTSGTETLAVASRPGTGVLLLINPWFFAKALCEDSDRVSVLIHEALHLENKHLHVFDDYQGAAQAHWTMATEISCNKVLLQLMHGMPYAHPQLEDGSYDTQAREETGINPDTEYKRYREALRRQGDKPADRDEFFASDEAIYRELSRVQRKRAPKKNSGSSSPSGSDMCGHGAGEEHDFDQEELDDVMSDVIDGAAAIARQPGALGDQMRDSLKRMFDSADGSEKAEQLWGKYGLGEMFGEPTVRRETEFWSSWLKSNLASRLMPGRRLRFNRKLVAVDHALKRDPILTYRGRQPKTALWVCIDTSGSMDSGVLEEVRQQVGDETKISVEYFCFDTDLYPIEIGDQFQGRGGTDFSCIVEAFERANPKPDCVLVLTDGYASEVKPKEKHRWVWLITPDGDDWPREASMATCRLPERFRV